MYEQRLPGRTSEWHFSHLGRAYFTEAMNAARAHKCWPIESISTGREGIAYSNKRIGRRVNPNWQVETLDGRFLRSLRGHITPDRFIENHLYTWPYEVVAREYGFPLSDASATPMQSADDR